MERRDTPSKPNGRLLTPDDVAERLRVTAEQVRALIRKGALPAINIGTGAKRPLYRISEESLEEFLEGRQQETPGPTVRRFKRLPPVPDHFPKLR